VRIVGIATMMRTAKMTAAIAKATTTMTRMTARIAGAAATMTTIEPTVEAFAG
jgi:hypothetical protein